MNLVQKIKKLVNNGNKKIRNNFSMAIVTKNVRESVRNELNNIYDDLVEDSSEEFQPDNLDVSFPQDA